METPEEKEAVAAWEKFAWLTTVVIALGILLVIAAHQSNQPPGSKDITPHRVQPLRGR